MEFVLGIKSLLWQMEYPPLRCLMDTEGLIHPVLNHSTGKGKLLQNHGFAVNREEAETHPDLEISHTHLNDNTVAGLKNEV